MQNLIKFHQFVQKIIINEVLTIIKGQNYINLQKLTGNNPNLDLV